MISFVPPKDKKSERADNKCEKMLKNVSSQYCILVNVAKKNPDKRCIWFWQCLQYMEPCQDILCWLSIYMLGYKTTS